MRQSSLCFLGLLLTTGLFSCSSPSVRLVPTSLGNEPANPVYFDGIAYASLPGGSVAAASDSSGEITLRLVVVNDTEASFLFDPTKIEVMSCWSPDFDPEDWSEGTCYSKEEWIDEVKSGFALSKALTAIGAGLRSAGASMEANQSDHVSGTYYDFNSGSYGSFSGTVQSYDPTPIYEADRQNEAAISRLNAKEQSSVEYWKNVYLGKTTIPPGYQVSGMVRAETAAGTHYLMELPTPAGVQRIVFELPRPE